MISILELTLNMVIILISKAFWMFFKLLYGNVSKNKLLTRKFERRKNGASAENRGLNKV